MIRNNHIVFMHDSNCSSGAPHSLFLCFLRLGWETTNLQQNILTTDRQLRSGAASVRLLSMVLHFLIQGRVQGVGFRWFVQREASRLDLRGWVRNTEEGEVEVVASGAAAELDALRAKLRQGPRGSRVDRLNEHPLADSEADELDSFRIDGAW